MADGFDPGLDLDIDFDLGDFAIDDGEGNPFAPPAEHRYCRPKLDKKTFTQCVRFRSAREFVDAVTLEPGARTFAWVDGSFIFGDVVEAFIRQRGLKLKTVTISTLSCSLDNLLSWQACIEDLGVERFDLLLSAYFYSHNKFDLVPQIYAMLDGGHNRFQCAFANVHTKLILLETAYGNKIVLHGSANCRSSQSIEQVMVEVDPDLYDFNRALVTQIVDRYRTIDKDIMFGAETWRAVMGDSIHPERKKRR